MCSLRTDPRKDISYTVLQGNELFTKCDGSSVQELQDSELNKKSDAKEVVKALLILRKLDIALAKRHKLVMMDSFRNQSGLDEPEVLSYGLVPRLNQGSTCSAGGITEDPRSGGPESTVAK